MNRKACGPERSGIARNIHLRVALADTLEEQVAERASRRHLFGGAIEVYQRAQTFDGCLRDLVLMGSAHTPTITFAQFVDLHKAAEFMTQAHLLLNPKYA